MMQQRLKYILRIYQIYQPTFCYTAAAAAAVVARTSSILLILFTVWPLLTCWKNEHVKRSICVHIRVRIRIHSGTFCTAVQ